MLEASALRELQGPEASLGKRGESERLARVECQWEGPREGTVSIRTQEQGREVGAGSWKESAEGEGQRET